jgi:hypothetical protein
MKNIHVLKQYIYITSNEEIKEGDWYLFFLDEIPDILQCQDSSEADRCNGKIFSIGQASKKIILTTDFNLSPDVQKIDDEFLEWFVKNPSCENIPIIMTTVSKESTYKTNIGFESWRKEEPKQDNRMYSEEEVIEILEHHTSYLQTFISQYIDRNDMKENDEWFEQFKKK